MTQVSIKVAETQLAKLIRAAREGEEVVITEGDQPVARIVSVPEASREAAPRRRAGSGKGLFKLADDFESPR
jgi:prevent-host-death family protein